jgi:DNA-binding transcriptional LysR family regulator
MAVHSKTEDLETFITVVDCGSFSGAANLLDQQVAKVSRAVSRLENTLQCTLLNRTTRRLELTEEGHTFIKYAREGLNTLYTGEEAIKLLKQAPSGKLRIDAASPFVLHQLTPLIGEFAKQYPHITLDITSHDSIIDLLEHKTDLAIRIGDLKDSNLHARKLGSSQLRIVASPEYIKNNAAITQIDDLQNHKIIGFSDSPKLNNWPLVKPALFTFSLS